MLLLLITLLYCLIFFFVIPENISTFLTLIALVLLTIYRLSAISSLLVFFSTHKLDSLKGNSTERLVAFLTVQHMLCFILEILDCYDYLVHITLFSSCAWSDSFCYYGIDRQYLSSHILATENLAIPSDWAKKPNTSFMVGCAELQYIWYFTHWVLLWTCCCTFIFTYLTQSFGFLLLLYSL